MLPDKPRLQTAIGIGLLVLVALVVAYNAGVARGRLRVRAELVTVQAELVALLSATPTISATPTETYTPAPTATPTATPTPTLSPTPTATPTSPEEWAARYQQLAEDGLTSSVMGDFTGEQAEALLRRIAQEQGLAFVPATYFPLQAEPWAALVTPRTPQGQALPILIWREPNDRNRVRSQLLLDVLNGRSSRSRYTALLGGLRHGLLRQDFLGRFHLLLVERAELTLEHNIYVLAQPQPGADFRLLWSSLDEPLWSVPAGSSQVELAEVEGALLPDLVVAAPLGDSAALRSRLNAPNTFIEQPPFARQWVDARWRFLSAESAAEVGGVAEPGYTLHEASLRPTPLTTLARLLQLLHEQNVSEAANYTTRLDLLQQAYDMGLSRPAIWLGSYLDAEGRMLPDGGSEVTERMRFFDNADRSRTFTALFELDEAGAYRVAAISPDQPYEAVDMVTPAAPLPTSTPTPTFTVGPPPQVTEAGPLPPPGSPTLAPPTWTFTPTPTFTPSPTPTETITPTPAPTATPTPTLTASPTPPPTFTPTPSATPSETPTETPSPTATPQPYPLPEIPPDQAPLAHAIVFRSPANLRAGPATDFPPVTQLTYGVAVDLYGITEAGDWILLRVNQPGDPHHGVVGWIAAELLQVTGDLAFLDRYNAGGTPVAPLTPTLTPTPGPPPPTPTPTPWATPLMQAPNAAPLAAVVAPQPAADELVLTIAGDRIPADPLSPIPALSAAGQSWSLAVESATVEIWSGLFGAFPGGWTPAPAQLLWPGTQVYVRGGPAADDPTRFAVSQVRIVAAPVQERARLLNLPDLAEPVAQGAAVAMMGSREELGVYLLETAGTLRQLWTVEKEAAWASPDGAAGVLVSTQDAPTGQNRFSWVRTDGLGVEVMAQPFHSLRGAAADSFGGLWWIETPQADLDQWQLWHYDPRSGRLALRLRATSAHFQTGSNLINGTLAPTLISVMPQFDPVSGDPVAVTLLLDTSDRTAQRLYTGLFRLTVRFPVTEAGVSDLGEVEGMPQLLLTPESYRGPLQVSPDRTKLAYFVYDPEHPSLTSGFIRPANMLRVLTLTGRGASTFRTVYSTESRFEFLAPNVNWQGNDRLIVARARFAPGDTFGVERFGIVLVQLPGADQPAGVVQARSYLFPNQRELRDFAACLDRRYTLTVAELEDGNLELARWDVEGDPAARPEALFLLPPAMSRVFLCWQAPDSLLAAP
ncbi:MAG TPA: SH3 domain-containing protein [Caldilineaceae bacterium]|nr:SH3 domain-containing protein [Caldilineaceae bacterium]